ncbi:MAG: hypothetical protein WCO60_00705 [Verrucomicrobiota bacterium]
MSASLSALMNTFFDECNTDIRKMEEIVPSLHEAVQTEWLRFSQSPFYPNQLSSFVKIQIGNPTRNRSDLHPEHANA